MDTASWFPDLAFAADVQSHRFSADWYGGALSILLEPNLYPAEEARPETYRLLVLPTFTCPVSIRVSHRDDTIAVVKRGSGEGGFGLGELAEEHSIALTEAAWTAIQANLEDIGFWTMHSFKPIKEGPDGEIIVGLDGTEFIIEGSRGDRYHVVNRWSPEPGAFYNLCRRFLNIAGPVLERLDYDPLDG